MTQDFHTYREIRQQPRVWRKAYDIIRTRKAEIQDFLNANLDKDFTIVLTGAGTSAYIGDALEPALSRVTRSVRAIATTDIITDPSLYFDENSKVLLISFARSGNSPESVGAVKAVEKTAGKVAHIFITCNEDGELAKMKGSNILTILLPPETNDVSLAMTSSYSTMLIVCSMIARIDHIEKDKESIDLLADKVEAAMDRYETKIQEIADRSFTRAIFLGSGALKGVAEESRLKLQELTDGAVMCAFDSFLGFRHGPKALVNPNSMLVYLLSNKPDIQGDIVSESFFANGADRFQRGEGAGTARGGGVDRPRQVAGLLAGLQRHPLDESAHETGVEAVARADGIDHLLVQEGGQEAAGAVLEHQQ